MGLTEDLRYGSRLLARSPLFTVTASLTVVLGILLNTAVFGIMNALWFGSLPFREDRQVMVITASNPSKGLSGPVSYQDYRDLLIQSRSFEGWAALSPRTYNTALPSPGGAVDRLSGGMLSASALDVLGYRPVVGRGLTPDDEGSYDSRSGPPSVLISEAMWRNRFGADPNVAGKPIRINGSTATVTGVLPSRFRFIYGGYQVIAPLSRDILESPPSDRGLQVLARLRHGVGIGQAQAELDTVASRLAAAHLESNQGWRLRVRPFREAVFGHALRMYPILFAAALLVLIVVCANVANLLLAKMAARSKEMAIRAAIGASRGRLVRQVLTEGALIAAIGGGIALVAAIWMRALLVAHYPEMADFKIDHRVLGYTLGITALAAAIFGLAPALAAAAGDVSQTLKSGSRSGLALRRWRGFLVVAQLALALMLLAGTGLMLKTITTLGSVDTGLNLASVTVTTVSLDGPRYADARRRMEFLEAFEQRLGTSAGARTAASSTTPLLNVPAPRRLEVAGRSSTAGDVVRVAVNAVTPGYFRAVGIDLIGGHNFATAEAQARETPVIVNQALATVLNPEAPLSAVGNRIRVGDDADWHPVVGVARDSRQVLYEPPMPEVFHLMTKPPADVTLIVDGADPGNSAQAMRSAIRELDPDLAIGDILRRQDLVELFYPKVMIGGLGIFAAVAVALASLGLYGVMASLVSANQRELAIRIALGAHPDSVVRMVVGQALRFAATGAAIGLPGGVALSRVLAGMLYGASSADPVVFGSVTVILAAVAVTAAAVPAIRAARLDPLIALRCE